MTLCDAGPLVALIDPNEATHALCRQSLPKMSLPLSITWPCCTEAMYLLYKARGHLAQDQLSDLIESGLLGIRETPVSEQKAMRRLMEKYRDTPMDLADASIVAAAEATGIRRIFTLDSDFRIYRLSDGSAFEVVP